MEELNVQTPSRSTMIENKSSPLPLSKIAADDSNHIPTLIHEFDRVLGGGYIPGGVVLIGGDPGIGKSTLLMQACSKRKDKILYVSGEESPSQIKLRAKRLGDENENLLILSENNLERIAKEIKNIKPMFAVVDSIQTVYTDDLPSAPGTVGQVRESAARLITLVKNLNIALLIVGHVTKDGSIAGPKVLEHMVDTVLYFEGERGHQYRILRTIKNRFGSTNEIGVFEMTGLGLTEVKDPSGLFISGRGQQLPGSAIVVPMEGSRPMLLEVQSLVAPSPLMNPRRTSIGIDSSRLALLVAVLEKIVGLSLYNQDIFLNVAGGMKIVEPSSDMGVIAAIHSSFTNKPLPHSRIMIGEVGLSGEIRGVMGCDIRLKEAVKLGFKSAIIPKSNKKGHLPSNIDLLPAEHIDQVLEMMY